MVIWSVPTLIHANSCKTKFSNIVTGLMPLGNVAFKYSSVIVEKLLRMRTGGRQQTIYRHVCLNEISAMHFEWNSYNWTALVLAISRGLNSILHEYTRCKQRKSTTMFTDTTVMSDNILALKMSSKICSIWSHAKGQCCFSSRHWWK